MGENPDREREEVLGRPAASPGNMRGQAKEVRERMAEEGRLLDRKAIVVERGAPGEA